MDLHRHLRFFAAVAEHRHFGRAATALGMTQPPVSQGVQRLERHLGQQLFDRSAREVRLTEAGAALLPRAQELLAGVDDLVARARRWTPQHPVRVGLAEDLDDLAPTLVGALVGALDVGRGASDVLPRVDGSTDLLDALRAGRLDVAVVRHPGLVDGLVAAPVRVLHEDGSAADPDLPALVPPRRHHPAAHDQYVDALLRAGHSGDVVELPASQRAAWAAAGRGVPWSPGAAGRPAVRYRVVAPAEADRRPEVAHDVLVAALDEVLAQRAAG